MSTTTPIGSYVSHDKNYFPNLVVTEDTQRASYMTDDALSLAQQVVQRFSQIALFGPNVSTAVAKTETTNTYISPEVIDLSKVLHQRWVNNLNKPIPSQEFPLSKAA